MYGKHFLHDHRTVNALRWAKAPGGLSEIFTTHGTYSSHLPPIDLLKEMPTLKVFFQTEPSDHIDCVWILNSSFTTLEVEDILTKIVFDDGTSILIPVPQHFIDQKRKRLHSFFCYESQLNYIFPSSKEFQQYDSNVYHQ